MSKEHKVWRYVDGELYLCKDIGCDDFDQAKRSRELEGNYAATTGYQQVESALAHTPLNKPLPLWIPRGELIQIGGKEWRILGGEREGIHELAEAIVVDT